MSRNLRNDQKGFTLPEMILVISMSSLLLVTLFIFSSTTVRNYMRMQAEGLANSKAAEGAFRISRVLRSANFVEEATDDRFTAYTYFAPQDRYTSKITYYLDNSKTKLLADVTAMTADYPGGILIADSKKTVVIIDKFLKRDGLPTFKYATANHTPITTPVTDLQAIKNISVNIYARLYENNNTKFVSSSVSVNLRNRKTNL